MIDVISENIIKIMASNWGLSVFFPEALSINFYFNH